LSFKLSPRDDIEHLAAQFSKNKYVRIFNFINANNIQNLSSYASGKCDFSNAFSINGKNHELSDTEISKLPIDQRQNLIKNIHQHAAQGVGFLYGRRKIEPHNESALPTELRDIFELMNSDVLFDLISKITGLKEIKRADAQVTRYRIGDFLTRHLDIVPGETRRFAYVIGLSDNWHPDWGGLLQFFERNGTPTTALSPVFNSLSIFDVSEVHSVTAVAPFAPQSRYSITGWLRS
jgi:Rps23 Pro-64 3,4-dihydroxylase Tpa1-like proline 4-hydroxylase